MKLLKSNGIIKGNSEDEGHCGVNFTEAKPESILTALCFEIAYSLLRKIRRELKIQMFPHQDYEPLEIKCNFQRPSSS